MTEPPERPPGDDAWPVNEEPTVASSRETLVGAPAPSPAGPAGPPPDRRVGAGMLLALAVLALVAIGILVAWLLTNGNDSTAATTTVIVTTARGTTASPHVAVPRLIGLKEQAAVLRLGQVGLRPKEVFRPTKKPKGLVVAQKPKEATSLARGAQVTLVVDSGAPRVVVPDVRGKSLAEARAALDALGLESVTTQVAENKPPGTVVDQGPKTGTKVAKGSAVTLSVVQAKAKTTTATTTAAPTTTAPTTTAPTTTAAAPQTATVPDVEGQTEAGAAQRLLQAGVLASIVFVPADDTLGTVEQQAKPEGTVVPFRSHVQVNVSTGPGDKPSAQVPNTIGQSLQQAVATMNGAQLRLIYVKLPVTSRSQAGKVVQQTPMSGNVPQNAQVLVYLGAFRG
jgi:beta-lactam-binding protein with PASTA domain